MNDPRPMQPLDPSARRLKPGERQREPITAILGREDDTPSPETAPELEPLAEDERPRAAHREGDPLFAYLVIVSLAIGISPLESAVRYVVLWTLMGTFGALAYLFGGIRRMGDAKIDDLVWGVTFGFVSSFPFLLAFGATLQTVSQRMFDAEGVPSNVMHSWVFMALAFVVPLCESLFFRGGMQDVRSIFLTTLLATLWSAVLFFPHMELGGRGAIAGILLLVFALLNFMYSYVRFRNGLAAAWLCQVVSYTLLWFVPRLIF